VWLEHGELIGDDTDGHIDTIVRTAPNDTLLYMRFDNSQDPQYNDFIELEKQLKSLTTADGHPYRLLALPAPDAMYDEGDRLPATYANFVILNNLVIVPSYNQQEKDKEARNIIQQAFPQHEVISIDASTVVRQHGSLHCLTMQYPQNSIHTK
jgi:agmatine/peptidylarginine deiminase